MIDIFQNSDPATLARQFYQAAPNIDPTPLLGQLDKMNGATPPYVPDANSAASMPGADYMTKLNAANAGPGAAGLPGANWGAISSGIGMLARAQPQQAHLPDFQVQYPGGQPAKNTMQMPGPTVAVTTPPLSALFAKVRG